MSRPLDGIAARRELRSEYVGGPEAASSEVTSQAAPSYSGRS